MLVKPFTLMLALLAFVATAQSPQLSPKAAYDEAMRPLDLTRQSISNWSDTETAALAVTMAAARDACAARDPKTFAGADLIDLARLCAVGQSFPAVIVAATRYIGSPEAAAGTKEQLAFAYAALINAQLHTKDEPAALAAAKAMLAAVPYDATVADAVDSAIDYMQFVYTDDALTLAVARQPMLLEQMRQSATTVPATAPSLHDLYADGLAFAAVQQLAKAPSADVTATVAALDAALPAPLTPDDAIAIATTRRRYALLGRPLPDLARPKVATHPAGATHPVKIVMLDYPGTLPELPARNAITALLLFPDWCPQCLRMVGKFPQTVFTVSGHEAYLYALLAPTTPQAGVPPKPPAPGTVAPFDPRNATNLLRDTPTLVVDPSFLTQFAATDVPLLLLVDAHGILRVVQPVDEAAVAPGGTIDSAIACVGDRFPLRVQPPKSASPPPAH